MSIFTEVHEYSIDRQGRANMLRTNSYISVACDENPELFFCRGKVFSGDGSLVKPADVPGWAFKEFAKCTDEAIGSAGWSRDKFPGIKKAKQDKPEVVEKPKPKRKRTKRKKAAPKSAFEAEDYKPNLDAPVDADDWETQTVEEQSDGDTDLS